MWGMKLTRLHLVSFFLAHLLFQHTIYAQKRWDGEGADSLWSNSLNWHPNGIPTNGDTVILDNQWVHSNYQVYLPDSLITSYAYSIRIQPSVYQISLIIPSKNTAAPALSLSSLDTAICIDNGGVLLNNSGATAGNSIAIAGKLKILNGGRYQHQTLRGNALLIANLATGTETEKGIFEFNVPGNSAYTISASGRTFGSLVLTGQNSTRKTYTASGINRLNIEGDFTINEQAGFSSSLTNTVSIGGNLIVKGRLLMNPASGDTIGRCLESTGTNELISITGLFNQGIHFRKWLINGSYTIANSTITIEQPNAILHIQTGSNINMGSSIIKGIGKVIIDSNTNIATTAPTIIGADSMSNFQTVQLEIHHDIGFTCNGNNIQSTGERFPLIISKLHLDKTNEILILTKSLQIIDSLLLKKGIIKLAKDAALTILNYTNLGNDSSFVTSSLIQKNKKLEMQFPIGIDSFYTPISIIRNTDSITTYAITSSIFSSVDTFQTTFPPVEKITNKTFWTISKHDTSKEHIEVHIPILKNQADKLSCIAVFDTINNKWKLSPGFIATPNSNYLSINLIELATGLFTIGKLQQQALPLNNILLKKLSVSNQILLNWTVNDDENAEYYLIEQSKDARHFEQKDSVPSLKNKGVFSYVKQLKSENKSNSFYRIIGVDIDGNKYLSNIVHDQNAIRTSQMYPNPSNNHLQIRTNEKILGIKIIHPDGKNSSVQYKHEGNKYIISTSHLSAGNYFLLKTTVNGIETIPFIKQ